MAKAADSNSPRRSRRSSPAYKGIIDSPFPAFDTIPREELKPAYAWELDREFLDEMDDQHRPWPKLLPFEREAITPCVGRTLWQEERPPAAAALYPPERLLNFDHHHGKPRVMGLSSNEWARFHSRVHGHWHNGKPLTSDEPSYWKHLEDEEGRLRLVFAINRSRPIEDVLEDIRQELLRVHHFAPKKKPTREVDWASRLCDLLCLRLERMGLEWKEAFSVLNDYKKANSLGGMGNAKDWSTRRGRARDALDERRAVLERRVRYQVEYDEEKYGEAPPENTWDPLSIWSLQGWQGPAQPIGMEKPHKLMLTGLDSLFGKDEAFDHFLALRGLTRASEGVEWANIWFAFEDWMKDERSEYASFVRAAWKKRNSPTPLTPSKEDAIDAPPDE